MSKKLKKKTFINDLYLCFNNIAENTINFREFARLRVFRNIAPHEIPFIKHSDVYKLNNFLKINSKAFASITEINTSRCGLH